MKMVPYDYRKIENEGFYRKTKNAKILDEFLESGETCVEIVDYTHVNAYSCQGSLSTYIRSHKLNKTVEAVARNGRVFLVRIDKIEGKV